VKDYHFRSLHNKIEPLVLLFHRPSCNTACIKVRAVNLENTLAYLEEVWKLYAPEFAFHYRFLDQTLNGLYRAEVHLGKIFNYFTILTLFIACLGLFGLASFMAEQRRKEIGIRKALGASISGILLLLSTEFMRWVIIASIIAWPVAWYVMNQWLENFAYRIDISWWIFLSPGAMALLLALITVIFQSTKAALVNPVESLRYE